MAAEAMSSHRNILICYDLTIQSEDALDYYCDHVRRDTDYVILLYCPTRLGNGQEQTKANVLQAMVLEEINRMERDKKMMERELRDRKLDGKVITTLGDIVEKISETAKQEKVNLIIMGSRYIGRQTREQTGSTKSKVVQSQHIEAPILIVKKQMVQRTMKEHIAVLGTDLQKPSLNAMKFYKENFYGKDDSLHLLYCAAPRVKNLASKTYPPAKHSTEVIDEEKARLKVDTDRLSYKLTELGMKGQVLTGDPKLSPGQSIVLHAESMAANLIVLGSRCVGETTRKIAGESTSDYVLNECKMSVLIVKF